VTPSQNRLSHTPVGHIARGFLDSQPTYEKICVAVLFHTKQAILGWHQTRCMLPVYGTPPSEKSQPTR